MGTEEDMGNFAASSVGSDDVLQVESKWPYLPITPTYDQYVQRWVVMSEREGFHVKTRSVMKELLEDAKWMVLQDKFKKCALFKIRVDLWLRLHNLPEDRAKRAGMGAARRDRLEHTYRFFQHTWSDPAATERHYRDWLRSRRARGQ